MKPFRGRATYANVMSTFAVAIALAGGTAYAAGQITSSDIKDGGVHNADLAHNAVTSPKVKDGSLKRTDLARSAQSVSAFALVVPGSEPDFVPAFVGPHRGFTAVSRPGVPTTGVFCLKPATGVTVKPSSPLASVDWSLSGGSNLLVEPAGYGVTDCAAGRLEVHTFEVTSGTVGPSNDVAFTIAVP